MKVWLFGFLFICFFSTPAVGEDIMHATTEDISEFDKMLSGAPMAQPKKKLEKKPGMKPKDGKGPKPRDQFHKANHGAKHSQGEQRRPKGPPRDDRERGRKKPPPPKGGGPPPPPN